jgi:hypothetical protein
MLHHNGFDCADANVSLTEPLVQSDSDEHDSDKRGPKYRPGRSPERLKGGSGEHNTVETKVFRHDDVSSHD